MQSGTNLDSADIIDLDSTHTISSDSLKNGDGDPSTNSSAKSFFMPLSVKRAHAGNKKDETADRDTEQQLKRSRTLGNSTGKKLRGKRGTKDSNLQLSSDNSSSKLLFFMSRSERIKLEQVEREAEELAVMASAAAAKSEPAPKFVSINTESDIKRFKSVAAKREGIYAPFPCGFSHIPMPKSVKFTALQEGRPSTKYSFRDPNSVRVRGSMMQVAANFSSTSNIPEHLRVPVNENRAGTDTCDLIWSSLTKDTSPDSVKWPQNLCVSVSAPVNISLGCIAPDVPEHVRLFRPLIKQLLSKNIDNNRKTCTLASRYQPQYAHEVLGNSQAVQKLRLWTDSMKLKSTSYSMSGSSNEKASTDCESERQGRGRFKSISSRGKRIAVGKESKHRQRSRCIDGYLDTVNSDGDDDNDDDDFMPETRASRRWTQNDRGLKSIFAWAQSNGTLKSVRDKLHTSSRRRCSDSEGEAEAFTNIVLLEGPTGSGKTAAVYACAQECGYQVHELHPGQKRSSKDILNELENLICSHTIVSKTMPTTTTTRGRYDSEESISTPIISDSFAAEASSRELPRNQMLILIEQVDVIFEQDQGVWSALKQLALRSRRPIVLTCSDMSCIKWDTARFHSVIHFQRPPEHTLVPYFFLLCLSEGILVSLSDLSRLCRSVNYDINRMFSSVEVMLIETQSQDVSRFQSDPIITIEDTDIDIVGIHDNGCTNSLGYKCDGKNIAQTQDSSQIDLCGTLKWLLYPLGSDESPSIRYQLWYRLVNSAQDSSSIWYKQWPSEPDNSSLPTSNRVAKAQTKSRLGSILRPTDANIQNIYFSKNRLPPPHQPPISTPLEFIQTETPFSSVELLPVSKTVIPIRLYKDSSESSGTEPNIDSLDPMCVSKSLNDISAHLDSLSLMQSISHRPLECYEASFEPLFTEKYPLCDGCLRVNYVTLDSNVLSRQGEPQLIDNYNQGARQGVLAQDYIDLFLAHRPVAEPDQKDYMTDDTLSGFPSLCLGINIPSLPPSRLTKHEQNMQNLRRSLSHVDSLWERWPYSFVHETAPYLSLMVMWDSIHQGKIEIPARLVSELDSLTQRSTPRRTRTRTYRTHIKRVPVPLQKFLINWFDCIDS